MSTFKLGRRLIKEDYDSISDAADTLLFYICVRSTFSLSLSLAHRLQLFHYKIANWLLANAATSAASANERNNGRPHRAGAHCYTVT